MHDIELFLNEITRRQWLCIDELHFVDGESMASVEIAGAQVAITIDGILTYIGPIY